ncbi:PPE domain-containing protein [Mycobacterium uberis]|nr:PPE domain-containing protein [Mycobacterium uberis]
MNSWSGFAAKQAMEAAKRFVGWLTDLCEQLPETETQIRENQVAYE